MSETSFATSSLCRSLASSLHSILTYGARLKPDGSCRFRTWAPFAERVDVRLLDPVERLVPMSVREDGFFECRIENILPGARYFLRLDDEKDRPDPASRSQPEGVHGPSQVVAHDFAWADAAFTGVSLREAIFYELHIGTFTEQGTFDAAIERLDDLAELGVNFVQVMPVAAFPGERNWGYDGVAPFATQISYGGPDAFRRFVGACHERGIGVALDVVYNHLGPEGNYLNEFGPFFTEKYHTPWGRAMNFDERGSDAVRRFFIENALSWVIDFHVDALRLDAVHAIFDQSAYPFLHELGDCVHEAANALGRIVHLIPENDLNDPRLICDAASGGFGLDAQWCDDFHHALHALLTDEDVGYYRDFGRVSDLAKAMTDGFVYDWRYSHFRQRHHGASSRDIPAERFVACIQNHDQVGNRMLGERLASLVSFEKQKLAAATVLLSPFVPMLFMGEEHGETNPFLFFVSHTDEQLVQAVRKGRKREFKAFSWKGDPPDPQAPETFEQSRVDWSKCEQEPHRTLRSWYRELISVRGQLRDLDLFRKDHQSVLHLEEQTRTMIMQRRSNQATILLLFNFDEKQHAVTADLPRGEWRRVIDSADERWHGTGCVTPEVVQSASDHTLTLPGESFALLLQEHGRKGN